MCAFDYKRGELWVSEFPICTYFSVALFVRLSLVTNKHYSGRFAHEFLLHLALLLKPTPQVHGIIRRSSSFNTGRIDHIYRDRHETGVKLFLHYGDLCDATNLITIIANVKPDEIYNLGAMSHVKVSFDMPEVRGDLNFY